MPKRLSEDGYPPMKRPRIVDRAVHCNAPANADDEVSYKRNVEKLKAEQLKPKARVDVLKDLMKRTFANRFRVLLQGDHPVSASEYLNEFPLLKKATFVSALKVEMLFLIMNYVYRQLRNFAVSSTVRACGMTTKRSSRYG